jgi:hypothetical protein
LPLERRDVVRWRGCQSHDGRAVEVISYEGQGLPPFRAEMVCFVDNQSSKARAT